MRCRLGLGTLLAASEFWFSVLKGGRRLPGLIGLRMLRSGGSIDTVALHTVSVGSARSVFAKSSPVAVTNFKGYLFRSALLPQFIDPAAGQAQYVVLALLFAGLTWSACWPMPGRTSRSPAQGFGRALARPYSVNGVVLLALAWPARSLLRRSVPRPDRARRHPPFGGWPTAVLRRTNGRPC